MELFLVQKGIFLAQVKKDWEELASKSLELKNKSGDVVKTEPFYKAAMMSLQNMALKSSNEEIKRKCINDVFRLLGLEPAQLIQQQSIGVKKIFITKSDKSKVKEKINQIINQNNDDDKNNI